MISKVHFYLLKNLLRNIVVSLLSLICLFLVFDFFDRIDRISDGTEFSTILLYFILKIPQFFVFCLPIAFILGCLFTYGLLSKNSEITAMRASGLKLSYLSYPLLSLALVFSLISIYFTEQLVPSANREVKEIYNIDIKQRDKRGDFSQQNIWWRDKNSVYSIDSFDSRDSTLHGLSKYKLGNDFQVKQRTNASIVNWVDPEFGWNMSGVKEYQFKQEKIKANQVLRSLPLTIEEKPKDFYHRETDPDSLSYAELSRYIKERSSYGLPVDRLLPDLFAKFSFPFVTFFCCLVVFPLSIRPARSGSLAPSFILGVLTCFVYYLVHSFSLALGRAEIISPMFSAWLANIVIFLVGAVLYLGVEYPD